MKIRAIVTVTGMVQGVAYRQSTQQAAQRLDVNGWVKNQPDGSVKGCFEGEEENVEALIQWCHEGPRMARVASVDVRRELFTGEYRNFRIAY